MKKTDLLKINLNRSDDMKNDYQQKTLELQELRNRLDLHKENRHFVYKDRISW